MAGLYRIAFYLRPTYGGMNGASIETLRRNGRIGQVSATDKEQLHHSLAGDSERWGEMMADGFLKGYLGMVVVSC